MSSKAKISMRATLIALASCAAASSPAQSASPPPLNFTQIVSFAGTNGANPIAPLTADANGVLYGSTSKGGQTNSGVIFKLTPPTASQSQWTYQLLHDFGNYADGNGPAGRLLLDRDGALYGVTSDGGETGNGAVFKLTPPSWGGQKWTKTILYNFQGGTDSQFPYAGLTFDDHNARYDTDSANPYAGPTYDGHSALYGVASGGGATGNGSVFTLTPPGSPDGQWTETILHSFTGTDGVEPYLPLVFDKKGALYGATFYGGVNNQGAVFKLSPSALNSGEWNFALLYQFTGKADGANPISLTFDKSGTLLYGTAAFGGNNANNAASGNGTVFTLTPPAPGAGWVKRGSMRAKTGFTS